MMSKPSASFCKILRWIMICFGAGGRLPRLDNQLHFWEPHFLADHRRDPGKNSEFVFLYQNWNCCSFALVFHNDLADSWCCSSWSKASGMSIPVMNFSIIISWNQSWFCFSFLNILKMIVVGLVPVVCKTSAQNKFISMHPITLLLVPMQMHKLYRIIRAQRAGAIWRTESPGRVQVFLI